MLMDNSLTMEKYLSARVEHHKMYRAFFLTLADEPSMAGWELISQEEWQSVPRLAHLEGVSSLLFNYFFNHDWPTNAPQTVRKQIENSYYSTIAQNMMMYAELAHISAAFRGANIPVIALKGAANALILYPDVGLRQMSDMDLLIMKTQFQKATRLLVDELHYHEPPEKLPERLSADLGYDTFFYVKKPGVPLLELHWSLMGGEADWRKPDIAWFWSQVQHQDLSIVDQPSEGFLVLNPAANLLLSAAHLMLKHSGFEKRMIWLYDVHRMVSLNKDQLDWESVIAQSVEFGWAAALLACLQGVRELLHTPVPEGVLTQLEQVDDSRGRQFVYRKGIATRSKFKRVFSTLSTLDRKTQFKYILNQIFPTPKQVQLWYKPRKAWLVPFYYPLRWKRMVEDGILTLLKQK